MKIKSLTVSNFRNISSGVYNLFDRSAFEGRNHIGKTNLIEAIYWLLTGTLINGSSDVASIKPTSDKKAIVSAEIVFDNGWKFRKDYYENWVKTRGSDEVTLKGHSTDFYINGIKMASEREATKQLYEELGLGEINIKTSKVDPIKLFINPLYAPEQLEWKTLRGLIIELIGDISNEDVIKSDIRFERIRDTLNSFNCNTDLAIKSFKQQIATLKERNTAIQGSIDYQKKKEPVPEEKLAEAKRMIADISSKIDKLKAGTASESMSEDLAEKKKKATDLYNSEQKIYSEAENAKSKRIADAKSRYDYIVNQIAIQDSNNRQLEAVSKNIEIDEKNIQEAKDHISKIGSEEWMKLNASVCPNCGHILNQDKVDALKKSQVDSWTIELKAREEKLADDNKLLEDIKSKLDATDYKSQLEEATEEKKKCNNITFEPFKPSEELNKMKADYNELLEKFRKAQSNDEEMLKTRKQQLEDEKTPYQSIIKQDLEHAFAARDIASQTISLVENQKEITKNEQLQMLTTDFVAKKLEMLNENVSKVFGDIKFVLAESNIKAGSWNEVCYPLIVGTDTPFEHGSSSEKIKTGYLILESIKKEINAPDLPIIFDECEKFDSLNFEHTFLRNSQIITAKVNDDYVLPTVVDLK